MADELKPLIEAALYVSGKTVSLEDLAKICSSGNIGAVRLAAEELAADYLARNLGLEIEQSDKGFEMKVRKEYESKVMHLVPEADMPGAVLRVLALIASHQPIKQSDVIKLRGNGAYKYIKRLKEEELIESKKSSRTALLTTTPKFKEYFHILDMKELVQNVDNIPLAIVPSDEEAEKPEDDKQAVLTDVVDAETGIEKEIEERNRED
jgi:segregation and condensation protein B